jgi:O-antigen ligase
VKFTLYPARPVHQPSVWGQWFDRAVNALVVIALGVILGSQYLEPNKRLLSVAAAVIVIGIAWRLDMVSGIGVMILALPYPRGTVFGSTNIALILLLVIIYLLRMSQREVAPPRPTPADAPIAAFFLTYVVSFYNVESQHDLYFALQNFQLLVGTLIMFYLIVNSVQSEADVKRMHFFHPISIVGLMLISVWELNHPGATLVPGWINFENTHGDEFNRHGVRVGATFYDFELLADFCGLSLLFLGFRLAQQKEFYGKVLHVGIMVLVLFILFATVTRGPVVSLSIALVYLAFLMRRHLRVVPMTLALAGGSALLFGMNFFVSTFTRSGNLFERVAGTEMVGWMPETRVGTWTEAWQRMMYHPIIGWGPYYSSQRGLDYWYWPHNLYLYVGNLTGLVGLSFFLWMFWTYWRITRPRVDTPASDNYLDSYLFIANVQMAFFAIDQFKIEYLRNNTYQYQVWLMFAMWVSAYRVRRDQLAAQGIKI